MADYTWPLAQDIVWGHLNVDVAVFTKSEYVCGKILSQYFVD